jgi:undecaprenyl phosphate-alpha-L-ara4N flippase subunit ArnF
MSAQISRWLGPACLTASIVLSAFGQLGMKAGMQELHRAASPEGLDGSAASLSALLPAALWTAAGLAAYAVSLLAWLAVLVRYPLSYAYPLLGLSYVLVYIGAASWPQLMEPMTLARTAGTLLIIGGVALVSLTDERPSR